MTAITRLNTLEYDEKLCTGCERCVEVCPHGVFKMESGGARAANAGRCMECGACRLNCSSGAISVQSGVGCAWAMIRAALTFRRKEPSCGC